MRTDFIIDLLEYLIGRGIIASYSVYGNHITVIIKK